MERIQHQRTHLTNASQLLYELFSRAILLGYCHPSSLVTFSQVLVHLRMGEAQKNIVGMYVTEIRKLYTWGSLVWPSCST